MKKEDIRKLNSQELKEAIQDRVDKGGLSMTNYERSQYYRKLKAEKEA